MVLPSTWPLTHADGLLLPSTMGNSGTGNATVMPALRFGQQAATAAAADSVTDAYAHITAPAVCEEDVDAQAKKMLRESGVGKRITNFIRWRVMAWQAARGEKQGDRYLPERVQQALRRYQWSFSYWRDKFLGPVGTTERMCVVLKGPPAIKAMQARVEITRGKLEKLRAMDTFFQNLMGENIFTKGMRFLGHQAIRRMEKVMATYGPLLDTVPALPMSAYEKPLQRLQDAFAKAYPTDPIVSVDKTLGVGSMAQVFLAHTAQKRPVVLKVLRPDATPERIGELRDFLYYQSLSQSKDRAAARRNTESTLSVLQEECLLATEQEKAQRIAAWLGKSATHIRVPAVLLAAPEGIIQEYGGPQTLNQLDGEASALKRQALEAITPGLIQMAVLSPDKYLDFHGGNLLVEAQHGQPVVSLIDYGRMARMKPATHPQWLALMRAVYEQADLVEATQSPRVIHALAALAEGPGISAMDAVQRAKLLAFVFGDMLDAWVQASQWRHEPDGRAAPLIPLSEQALSRDDIQHVHAKMTNLLRGYFLAPPASGPASDPARVLADPADFLRLFDQSVYEKKQWRLSDSLDKHKTLLPTLLDTNKALPGFDDVLRAAMAGDAPAYRERLKDVLEKSPAHRARWAMMVSLHQRVGDLADQLVQHWPGRSPDADAKAHFRRNLAHELRKSFDLNEPRDFLPPASDTA